MTTTEQDAQAWRLRQQRMTWADIGRQIGLPETTWMGADALLAVHRGARQPVDSKTLAILPGAYKDAARQWNATLAARH
jgi:hypothetical protein